MPNLGTTVNNAHKAFDGVPSMLAVIGTLGTADVTGTALTLPLAVEEATGALYVQDLSGVTGTENVKILNGTLTALANGTITAGTLTNLVSGTINALASGTITAGTFTLNSKPGSQILSYGTTAAGTLGTLVNAGGVGTAIYVTSFSIDGDVTALGTPDLVLSFGTVQNGAGVIFRGALPTTTPFGQAFNFPVSGNLTNTPLTFMQLSGGGTIDWNITYFIQ